MTAAYDNNDKPSIRSIIMNGLTSGKNLEQITAEIRLVHPDSAAASKPAKHVMWYRATMKKDGVRMPNVRFFAFTSTDDLLEQLKLEPEVIDEDEDDLNDQEEK